MGDQYNTHMKLVERYISLLEQTKPDLIRLYAGFGT